MKLALSRQRRWRGRGFTLIEAAVVLVIIGVVLASVLQGRELIASAKYKSFKNALTDYGEAFHIFRDRYGALPGDFSDANADLGQPGGNGDGVIGNGPACSASTDESCRAWQHLRAASLLKGDPDDAGAAASPEHRYNGVFSAFFTGTAGNGVFEHKILVDDLPIEIAKRLDDDIDDGLCTAGHISSPAGCDGSDWDTTLDTADLVYSL